MVGGDKVKVKESFSPYDPAECIETKEDVLAFLEGALEEQDPEYMLKTIDAIARSKGMARLVHALGTDRSGVSQSPTPAGGPSFMAMWHMLDSLGYRLQVLPKTAA